MIEFHPDKRSSQSEIMDDFQLKGNQLFTLLDDLARVNQYLGGNRTVISGIKELLGSRELSDPLMVVDLGCGDGELLRHCSKWAKQQEIPFQGIGLDANPNILQLAKERSASFDKLEFRSLDVFDETLEWPSMDIAVCSLFLHHFPTEDIIRLLGMIIRKCRMGIVISDLERNKMALNLFKLISPIMLRSKIARHDGQVSVARAFTRNELDQISTKVIGTHSISRKWAYRWQWTIQPSNQQNR